MNGEGVKTDPSFILLKLLMAVTGRKFPAPVSSVSQGEKEYCPATETKDTEAKIKPFANLTPCLQNYPRPGTKANSFQISYPVYPSRK